VEERKREKSKKKGKTVRKGEKRGKKGERRNAGGKERGSDARPALRSSHFWLGHWMTMAGGLKMEDRKIEDTMTSGLPELGAVMIGEENAGGAVAATCGGVAF